MEHFTLTTEKGGTTQKILKVEVSLMFFVDLPSGKLTWQWNIPIFNRKYIFNWPMFHCYVSLPGCILLLFLGVEVENSVWLRVEDGSAKKKTSIHSSLKQLEVTSWNEQFAIVFLGAPWATPQKKSVNSFGSGPSEQFGTVRG